MSSFADSAQVLLWYETSGREDGAPYRDPRDPGGFTKWGVSSRYHPDADVPNLTRLEALELYRVRYWLRFGVGQLDNQQVATICFLAVVNPGFRAASRALQRACRATISATGSAVQVPEADGIMGPLTVAAANALPSEILGAAYRCEVAREFAERIIENPAKAVFERGWMARSMLDGLPRELRELLRNGERAREAAAHVVRVEPAPGEPGSEGEGME